MKYNKFRFAALMTILLCLAVSISAGETRPRTWWGHQVVADPTVKIEYEKDVKAFLQEFDTSLSLRIDAVESAESVYTFFATLEDSGTIEHHPEIWVSTLRRISQEMTKSLKARGLASSPGEDGWLLTELPNLSYAPDGFSSTEPGFIRYTFNYVAPGKNKAALRVLRDLRELYEQRQVASAMVTLQATRGDGSLIFVVSEGAKNRDDFFEQQEELKRKLGKKGRSLRGKMRTSLGRTETFEGIRRPDLSHAVSPAPASLATASPASLSSPEPSPAEPHEVIVYEPLPPESPSIESRKAVPADRKPRHPFGSFETL